MLEFEDGVSSFGLSSFILRPHLREGEKPLPYFIDGEEFEMSEISVRMVPNAITLYTGVE